MSPWSREVLQLTAAIVAVAGLGILALAFHGPLVAAGAGAALLGFLGVAVGYVGILGPPPRPPADVDPVQALLERTRMGES